MVDAPSLDGEIDDLDAQMEEMHDATVEDDIAIVGDDIVDAEVAEIDGLEERRGSLWVACPTVRLRALDGGVDGVEVPRGVAPIQPGEKGDGFVQRGAHCGGGNGIGPNLGEVLPAVVSGDLAIITAGSGGERHCAQHYRLVLPGTKVFLGDSKAECVKLS